MSDISALGPVESRPPALLADRAYEELRDRLVTLQIKPGEPIDEDRLGAELEMGRTPIREAIKRLSLENLVSVFPRRGTFAAEINIKDLAHITEVRAVLEARAAALAAERLTDGDRAELLALIDELHGSRGGDGTQGLMALDTRIHRFIYRACDNPFLEETLQRYFNLSLRIWYLVIDRLPHLPQRVHEHEAMLRAIADRRPELAAEIAAGHVDTFESEIRSVL
ncbi:MAG TPA: GntR family transcriptional regulator [Solirubrobacteraceae bacterium]|nr:GntR family transcriptional regulator [Solirubrobacteraceae bacterium]